MAGHLHLVFFGDGYDLLQPVVDAFPHFVFVGTITTATPIAQIALAHWILQEPVTWNLAGGGVLILAGVFGMVCAERSQTENEPN